MKTDVYTYEELDKVNKKMYEEELYEIQKVANESEISEIGIPSMLIGRFTRLALRYYIMDEDIEKIKTVLNVIMKVEKLELEEEKNSTDEYLNSEFHGGILYVEYLRLLSLSILLGYQKEDIEILKEAIHVIKGRDFLLDYLLSGMVETEVSKNVMRSNAYPQLLQVIEEQDKEKAETMLVDFMKNDWWNCTGMYEFRDEKNINVYTGAFAYEVAAIVKLKALDYSKFKDIKYFPTDLLYYSTGEKVSVKNNVMVEKELILDGKKFVFKTNDYELPEFGNADLHGYSFENMKIEGVSFRGANLEGAKFINVEMINCDFTGTNLATVIIEDSKLEKCKFKNTDGMYLKFFDCRLYENIFKDMEMYEAAITRGLLENNEFNNVGLIYVDLTGSDLIANKFINSAFAGIIRELDEEYKNNEFIDTNLERTKFTFKEKRKNKFSRKSVLRWR